MVLSSASWSKLIVVQQVLKYHTKHIYFRKRNPGPKYHMDFLFSIISTLYLFWNSRISFSFWDTVKEFQAQSFINEYQDCILLTSVVQSPTTLSMTILRYSVGLNNTSLMFLLKIVHPSKGLSLVKWSWGSWEQILVKNWKQHPWVGPWRRLLQNGEDF